MAARKRAEITFFVSDNVNGFFSISRDALSWFEAFIKKHYGFKLWINLVRFNFAAITEVVPCQALLIRFDKGICQSGFADLSWPSGFWQVHTDENAFSKKEALWINLLDQRLEFELSNDPDFILKLWAEHKPPWIIIVEVQKIPRILDVVHRGIEDHKIRFALTGSSARKLKYGGANLLAGRAASYALSPLSAFELGNKFNLDQALSTGLLPRLWSEVDQNEDRVRALYAYVQTYLKEEVAAEQLVRNLDPFRRVLVAAAQSNSRIINFAAIERDAGVSHSQAERHFDILVDTMLGRYLEPFETSLRKRQTKQSKFYFFDTGVVRALTNLAGEALLPSTYEYGELFETFLINECFKLAEALEKRWRFSFFSTKDGVEIDLIIEKPRGRLPQDKKIPVTGGS